MAASIVASKIIQHYTGVLDNTGATVVIGYEIAGLDPSLDPFGQALLVSGMPVRGDGLAGFSGIVAQRFEFKKFQNSRTKCWILVTYRPPEYFAIGEAVVTWDDRTKTVARHYDGDGRPLKLEVKDQEGVNLGPANIQAVDTVSCGCLYADWTTFENPAAALLPYKNTVNTDVFRGTALYTWWFSKVRISKQKFHSEYNVHVEIEYDPEGFLQTYFWRDVNGNIPIWIKPELARNKGPGIYKDLGFVRGTLKRGKSFANVPSLIPEFNSVVPDLSATKYLAIGSISNEPVEYPGSPWI